jgi:hypothetical protein
MISPSDQATHQLGFAAEPAQDQDLSRKQHLPLTRPAPSSHPRDCFTGEQSRGRQVLLHIVLMSNVKIGEFSRLLEN